MGVEREKINKIDFERTTVFIALSQFNEDTRNLIFEGKIFIVASHFIKLNFKNHPENNISCSANYIF